MVFKGGCKRDLRSLKEWLGGDLKTEKDLTSLLSSGSLFLTSGGLLKENACSHWVLTHFGTAGGFLAVGLKS